MKALHLTLCALMSLGLSGGAVPAVDDIITANHDIKKEDLHYYSDVMGRKDLPICFFSVSVPLAAGFTCFLGIVLIFAPKVGIGAIVSGAIGGAAVAAFSKVLAVLLAVYFAFNATYYFSKKYSVTSPKTLKEMAIATRIASGYEHFKDPNLQDLRQLYSTDPTKAWDFFWGMYSVDAPYFLCAEQILFYPGKDLPEDIFKKLSWPPTISTQDMNEDEWKFFQAFALRILGDSKVGSAQKVTAALKILEWVRNATQQYKLGEITKEARKIVQEIIKDPKIKTYLDTQEEMFQEIVKKLGEFSPVFEAYGSDGFNAAVDDLKFFNPMEGEVRSSQILAEQWQAGRALKIQNEYQQDWVIKKIVGTFLNINQTGYDGAIILRKIISSEMNKIHRKYAGAILASYKLFYSELPSNPETDLTWLTDEKCPDVVRYGLIEMITSKLEAKYDPTDDLTFADTLAELCMRMLRKVLFAEQAASDDEAELNRQVSESLAATNQDKAVKVVKIISLFFEKLFTANERDRFMGSVGFYGEDKDKRLIILTLWHLKANYPNIISIKLEEYYKANRRWGDYFTSLGGELSYT